MQQINNEQATKEVTEIDLVFISDKEVMTDSLIVAEVFGKDHGKVLRDIRQLIKEIESFGGRAKFGLISYLDSYGREMPKYTMDKDAFLMLVMGYRGAKATEIRYRYIQAFNAMYDRLKLQKSIDEELAEAIKLDEVSFMSASEAAKVMKRRQVDKPAHKDSIQRILDKKQKVFAFMYEDKQQIH